MIDIVNHLRGVPASRARMIAVSALYILNAGEIVSDRAAAVAEARRIHRNGSRWRAMQRDARAVLDTCEREGLTLERPYRIERHADGRALLWTVDGSGRLFPASWVGRGK